MDDISDDVLKQLSNKDLQALADDNFSAMSTEGLNLISGEGSASDEYRPFFQTTEQQAAEQQALPASNIENFSFGRSQEYQDLLSGRESQIQERTQQREAQMAQLQETNPFLAEEIQNTGFLEATAIGAGSRVASFLRGIGLKEQASEAERQAYGLLREQNSGATLGEFAGEAGMFIAPGGVAAKAASFAPRLARIPLMATYAMGEGGVMARGDEAEGMELALRLGLSGVLGGVVGGFLRGVPTAKERQVVEAIALGRRTPETTALRNVLDNPSATADDILDVVNKSTDPHPIIQGVRQAAEAGEDVPQITRELIKLSDDALENNQAARYILDGSENLRTNPTVRGVASSWDEAIATTMSGASNADKKLALKVLNLFKKGRGQGSAWAGRNRPQNPIGEEILRQYNFLRGVMNDTGQELGNVAKNQLRGAAVNLDNARSTFLDDLANAGVNVVDDGLDFSNSAFLSRLAKPQRDAINDTYQMLFRENIDGLSAHRMKGAIDEMVNFDKAAGGLGSKAENILKNTRRMVNTAIGEVNDTYKGLNSIYSETVDSLNLFQRGIGTSVDLADSSAGSIVAQKVNTLMSNNVGRGNLQSALDSMARLARKNGGSFDIDPYTQVAFIQALEARFGTQATRSLGGIIETALDRRSLREQGLDKIADLMQSDNAAINSMEALLKQGN